MRGRSRFYLFMAIALNVVMFWGFSQTYFAPMISGESAFGGSVADLPLIVHLHGWAFFSWYLLLLLQAGLISTSNRTLHRRLGMLSPVLVVTMVITGFIVMAVNIHLPLEPGAPPIWTLFGPVILATLILFAMFYTLAIRNRKIPAAHKRYMVVAGAVGLGAAVFRVLLTVLGPNVWNIPVGILLTNLAIVAGILHDWSVDGKVHRAYWIGLVACLSLELVTTALPHTPIGKMLLSLLGTIGGQLLFLYE
jgi:hypothetical protein